MELRPYQNDIIVKTRKVLARYQSPCVVLGCGGGKSVICGMISKMATDKGNRVLFLVHRIELVDQIVDTFKFCNVNMELCDVKMVQSAHKLVHDYKLIITDEAHHSTAKTYQNLYNRYPEAKRVNVTATPCRTDGRGLVETCDYLLETVSTKWLIENNYLAPYKYFGINLLTIKPKKVRGEYEDLTETLSKPKIYGDIMKYYREGSKVICYCSGLEHSRATAEEFNSRNIPSSHIDGGTEKTERKQIIEDFRSGKIKVLCNFSLLGEGFDVPDCDTVMILRKTSSLNLFIQMSMRSMRYKPNKIAYIYDFCGNCYEHGLPDDDRKWSLDSNVSIKKNPDAEPDVLVRICSECFRAYSSTEGRYCPYCNHDNGKTKAEIKADKEAELVEIKRKDKIELHSCKNLDELIEYAVKKEYEIGWVCHRAKLKKIKYSYNDVKIKYNKIKNKTNT